MKTDLKLIHDKKLARMLSDYCLRQNPHECDDLIFNINRVEAKSCHYSDNNIIAFYCEVVIDKYHYISRVRLDDTIDRYLNKWVLPIFNIDNELTHIIYIHYTNYSPSPLT